MIRTILPTVLLSIFLLCANIGNSLNRDSVWRQANNKQLNDTLRVRAFCDLIVDCSPNEKERAAKLFKKGLQLANPKIKHFVYGEIYGHYANYHVGKLNDYSKGLTYMNIAIEHHKKSGHKAFLANCYHFLARNIFERLEMHKECIKTLKTATEYMRLANHSRYIFMLYELGWYETYNGEPDSAFVHLQKSYELSNFDKGFQIELLTWMGNTFDARKQYRKALYYQLKAMRIADSLAQDGFLSETNRYAANTYRSLGKFDSSVMLMKKAVEIYMRKKDDRLYYAGASLINWLAYDKRFKEAKEYIDKLDDGKIIDYKRDDQMHARYVQAKYFYAYESGDYKNAIEYMRTFLNLDDSIRARMKRYDLSEQNLKMNFVTEQQKQKFLQQKKDLESKAELQRQKTFAVTMGGIVVLVILMLILSVRNTRQKQAAYKEISVQKKEVELQKSIIETKNKEITDSIHYAKRIQSALLAHKEQLNEFVPDNFIYFKPKDIVSGDFYWNTKKLTNSGELFYFAVCDSTGHGVPGAFMSLLNIGFLSEAISEKNILDPGEVFAYVRNRLINTISSEGQKDGFDGILICYDIKNLKLTYAAANNAMLHCTNGGCIKLPHDRIPVGQSVSQKDFTTYTVDVKKGDIFYLLTDGFADQFGGEKGKRFMSTRLQKLLNDNAEKIMGEQLKILDTTFEEWKGDFEQVDDVCVIGIRI